MDDLKAVVLAKLNTTIDAGLKKRTLAEAKKRKVTLRRIVEKAFREFLNENSQNETDTPDDWKREERRSKP